MTISIELAILLSVISVSFAVYFGLTNKKRSDKKDIVEEATHLSEISTKLGSIDQGVLEIKNEIKGIKKDVDELRERTVRAEVRAESAHDRLNRLHHHEEEV